VRSPFLPAVDLTIAAGQCVCISGPSGSGKSTLLRAAADLDPHEGRIFLDNTEQRSLPAHQWRRRVGLLPAESQWWFDTARAHFPRIETPWFEQLGVRAELLDSAIGRLSSGERQRLALLRLLCHGPQALLLDEATANLDPANTAAVEALIADYSRERGAAVLWVSHDPAQIRRVAQRHFRFGQGGLTAQEIDR
jgi:ABC-type iron transport system FetAB ATPase subunit